MNIITPLSLMLVATATVQAAVDWKPTFNDKPVPPALSAAIDKALPDAPIVSVAAPRRVLVYSATAGYRHKSIPTGKEALAKLGASSGAYTATVSDDPANFEAEALKGFDAVVLLSPTRDFFMPNGKQRADFSPEEWTFLQQRHNRLVDNLVQYLEQGGGLVGIHSATDSCYGHKAYGEAMGAYFNGHPWMAGHTVTINVEDPEHALLKPVFGDKPDFQIKDEIYQFKDEPYSREKLRILLSMNVERSDPPHEKMPLKRADGDYAVSWVQGVGKGRVFYTSLGHNHEIYSNPLMLKHYLSGIQFACGDLKADVTPSAKLEMPNVAPCCGSDEWQSLFDGETLNGWTQQNGTATYEVREGVIVGRSVLKSPNSFLCTNETFGDFELEFEVKCGAINSGVQIRSLQQDDVAKGHVQGPQVEIEHSPGQSGYIYGEAYSRSWRSPEPKSKDPKVNAHSIFKNDEWNHYRIVARGARIQTTLNGALVADLDDPESYEQFPRGMIGLQVHSHQVADVEIEWRNIRLREIK
ncbi:MAG: type 1 glutamine amidotransferase [Lentimonas sp.]|jgi:type 1 glutamine amidotransferase